MACNNTLMVHAVKGIQREVAGQSPLPRLSLHFAGSEQQRCLAEACYSPGHRPADEWLIAQRAAQFKLSSASQAISGAASDLSADAITWTQIAASAGQGVSAYLETSFDLQACTPGGSATDQSHWRPLCFNDSTAPYHTKQGFDELACLNQGKTCAEFIVSRHGQLRQVSSCLCQGLQKCLVSMLSAAETLKHTLPATWRPAEWARPNRLPASPAAPPRTVSICLSSSCTQVGGLRLAAA